MKFIHLADAHLDSPFRGLSFLPSNTFNQIYQAADNSLKKIVDIAIDEKVDLVLIAGDTFDSNQPSPRSQVFFAEQMKRLTDNKIQVVMIFGNHDHMKASDLLVPDSPFFKLLGTDEQVESVKFKTKTGFKYQVNGFSYLNNHITEDKISEFPNRSQEYTFGIMHVQEKTSEPSLNVYAPFTIRELQNLKYDYFALGHIHLRQTLSKNPLIVYPGNIQGRHINEDGAKGCYLGEIDEDTFKTQVSFKQTSPIVWQKVDLELSQPLAKNDLQVKIINSLNSTKTTYFSLKLIGAQYLTDDEMELLQDTDYWQSISAQLGHSSQLVDVRFKASNQWQLSDTDKKAFDQAAEEIFTPEMMKKLAKDWSNKSNITQTLLNDSKFIENVKALTKVKLSQQLKGITDETEEN